jgi:3-oxoacyl-[acyl-carrier protein] reductase
VAAELAGRTALVTGASQGIGEAVAAALARDGAAVVLVARNAAKLQAVAGRIRDAGGIADVIPADLADESNLSRVADREDDYWRNVIAVNYWATYVLMREAANGMKSRQRGCIVNVTSSAGIRANPFLAQYSSTKAAVEMLSRVAAMELGEYGIRVVNVAPGWIDTTHPALTIEGKQTLADDMPMKRAGRPEELAELVSFIVSDRASYLSGSTIVCDGALLAGNYERMKLLAPRLSGAN